MQNNGTVMLAVGASGICRESTDDGVTWAAITTITSNTIWKILSKDQGEFILSAGTGVIETSPSGILWGDWVDWNRPSISPIRYTSDIVDVGASISFTPLIAESIAGKSTKQIRYGESEAAVRAAACEAYTGAQISARYIQRRSFIYGQKPSMTTSKLSVSGNVVEEYRNDFDISAFLPGNTVAQGKRSEERRVGKECRSRWSPEH